MYTGAGWGELSVALRGLVVNSLDHCGLVGEVSAIWRDSFGELAADGAVLLPTGSLWVGGILQVPGLLRYPRVHRQRLSFLEIYDVRESQAVICRTSADWFILGMIC